MIKRLNFLLIGLLCFQIGNAQLINSRKRADSLSQCYLNISKIKNRNEKGNLYFQLAITYISVNIDSAIFFANEGIQFSKSSNYGMLEGRMYLAKGGILKTLGEYEEALINYNTAIRTSLRVKDSIAAASALNDKGISLQFMKRYNEAKGCYLKSIDLFLKLDNEAMTGMSLGSLSLLSYYLGEYVDAVRYANESISIMQKYNYPNFMVQALNVLGNIAKDKGDYKTALKYYEHSKVLTEKTDDIKDLIIILTKLGEIASLKNEEALAEDYYKEAIELSQKTGENKARIVALIGLAKIQMQRKQYKHAEDILQRVEIFTLKDNAEEDQAEIHFQYGKLYAAKKQNKLAEVQLKQALSYGLKVPYNDCSRYYIALKNAINKREFNQLYPNTDRYLDSINKQKAKLKLIPFGYDITDLNQPIKSQRDIIKKVQTTNNSLTELWLGLGLLLILGMVFITKRKARIKKDANNEEFDGQFQIPQIIKIKNREQNLSKTYSQFNLEVNGKLLLTEKIYLNVDKSKAQALSERTKGAYSINQIRAGFKAITSESFNDYKFNLRVNDYVSRLIRNKINGNYGSVNSNDFGLDSDRQLSVVVNAIIGIKLTSYKNLINTTCVDIIQHLNEYNDILNEYTPIEIHASLLRMKILLQLVTKKRLPNTLEEQNKLINQYIQNFKLSDKNRKHLKVLNGRNVDCDNIYDLYLSALYFWVTQKQKYPIDFIQRLTNIYWGFHIEEQSIKQFKKQAEHTELKSL